MILIVGDEDQSGTSEWDDDNVMLHVNGNGTPPSMMKGKNDIFQKDTDKLRKYLDYKEFKFGII